jgi:hypothetical protein
LRGTNTQQSLASIFNACTEFFEDHDGGCDERAEAFLALCHIPLEQPMRELCRSLKKILALTDRHDSATETTLYISELLNFSWKIHHKMLGVSYMYAHSTKCWLDVSNRRSILLIILLKE